MKSNRFAEKTISQWSSWIIRSILFAAIIFITAVQIPAAFAAPKAELWPRWEKHNPEDATRIDHSKWASFLERYLDTDHPSGINRVRYASVTREDARQLEAYLEELGEVAVTGLNRAEQKAYWINAYNALTVKVILDHYPVDSIMDIDLSGWFSKGPWKAELMTVEGEDISLDDIEHRILRPIWQDNRIHYAVNCASIGCPDLRAEPFTRENMEELLDASARQHINHPRGVQFTGKGDLRISSIYKWFRADFGDSEEGVLKHLAQYADDPVSTQLKSYTGDIDYHYNWDLNEP